MMRNKELLERKEQYDRIVEEGVVPLPELLKSIHDDTPYQVKDVAELVMKSEETVRRWIRQGQLEVFSPGHYLIRGKDLKRFLFAKSYKKYV